MAETRRSDILHKDVFNGPSPDITKTVIDFANTPLTQYAGRYAAILDNVLTSEECAALLAAAESQTNGQWERASINTGGGQQAVYSDVRKCGRIILDDREIAARIWSRCAPHLEEILRLESRPLVTGLRPFRAKEVWTMTRLNERMRVLRYEGGEYFKAHCDATFQTPDTKERSYFTLHLYLNDETSVDVVPLLEGGATRFEVMGGTGHLDVNSKIGRVLCFQQRDLLHSGADVIEGTKITLRTDIMFEREEVAAIQ